MNILIKLMSIVSLVIAPTLAHLHPSHAQATAQEKRLEFRVVSDNLNDTTKGVFKISTNDDSINILIEALKKDGIVKGNDVKVEILNNKLIVNGVEQPENVLAKYAPLLGKEKKVSIQVDVK